MTSPEPAPPADPTSYRRRGAGAGGWLIAIVCVVSIAAGISIARFIPNLFPVSEKATITLPSIPFIAPGPETPPGPAETPPPAEIAAPMLGVGGDLAGLKSRIERLEASRARTSEAAGVALATASLIEAAQTSHPFEGELAQVAHLLPQSADVAALRALANTGAPTRQALASEFADSASGAIAAAAKPGPNAGLLQRMRYAVASVITVRRVGDVKGKAVDAVLARAEVAARDGDLERALNELATLPPNAQAPLSTWAGNARARVEIDRRVASIRAAALRALNDNLGGAQ